MLLVEEEEDTIPMAPVRWEEGICLVSGQRYIPIIYDRNPHENAIPDGFNAVTITLDGQWKSELKWDAARSQALHFSELGYKLLWQINLGLFDQLPLPLENQSQLMGLELSLKHFCQTLWKEFETITVGLVLFRGSANFAERLTWSLDQELACEEWVQPALDSTQLQRALFAADVASHYLLSLTSRLPDALPLFLLLDASEITPLDLQARLFTVERYDRILLGIKGSWVPHAGLTWEEGACHFGFLGRSLKPLSNPPDALVGVSLPAIACRDLKAYAGLDRLLCLLNAKSMPYKIIPEERLALEWSGLETLFFSPTGSSEAGKRQLRGFAAAGGNLVSLGEFLGLPGELLLSEWFKVNEAANG